MDYKGIFFDFDYTLGDSTLPIVVGFQQGFAAMGLDKPTEAQVRPTIGMTLMDGYTHITGDSDPDRRQQFYRNFQQTVGEKAVGEYASVMAEKTVLFPGAVELLTALHEGGVKVALVSTKAGGTIRQILDKQGIAHLVDLIVGGKDVTHAKPHPEGLEFALRELGLERDEVLFCGDTVIDAATAQNGGTDFAAVLNGTTPGSAFDQYPHRFIAADLPALHGWLYGN